MKKVWINGTFDVLHLGHLILIREAYNLGSLKIGIDSDKRIKETKNKFRPINSEYERKEMLLALKGVESVEIFSSEEELVNLIESYSPDYFVIGSDYKDKKIIGSEFSKEIVFIERMSGYSSSNKIIKTWNLYEEDNNSRRVWY
jgi:D-beta-D-heptose 7-phosphate kinase/D-beta-D-heptose 1-phosphate adenosyltransferase